MQMAKQVLRVSPIRQLSDSRIRQPTGGFVAFPLAVSADPK